MKGYIYIITDSQNKVLYTGVTSCLKDRIWQHKTKKYPFSFSARNNLSKLVYYEEYDSIVVAIKREKQIKAGSRAKKLKFINSLNPDWADLYMTLEA